MGDLEGAVCRGSRAAVSKAAEHLASPGGQRSPWGGEAGSERPAASWPEPHSGHGAGRGRSRRHLEMAGRSAERPGASRPQAAAPSPACGEWVGQGSCPDLAQLTPYTRTRALAELGVPEEGLPAFRGDPGRGPDGKPSPRMPQRLPPHRPTWPECG